VFDLSWTNDPAEKLEQPSSEASGNDSGSGCPELFQAVKRQRGQGWRTLVIIVI